jgi:tetratricopeptide (TPR) repeat protein
MGILKKLFGKKDSADSQDVPGEPEDMLRMYDLEGNQVLMAKSVYRKDVLPNMFAKAVGNPDELYGAIVLALQDGFFEECLPPARQLFSIDNDRQRSATILGITLMENNQTDEAQEVLENFLKQNGDSGVVLTNLAKVFSRKGLEDKSVQTLWKALTVDPNQDNALAWWGAIQREKEGKEGDDGFYRAMEQAAQLSGSWRPQLWLARRLLEQKKIDPAVALYRKVLESSTVSADALMMISGDLGNSGYLAQMLDLVLPFYESEKHGHMAGLNLIQACIRTGDKETGLRLCDAVEKLKRYDIKQYLEQMRTQLKEL